MPENLSKTSSAEASSKKPLEDWRKAVSARRSWFANRDQWHPKFIGSLKTLAWVIPLTILIWIYAEREQQLSQKGIPAQIHVRINSPNKLVRLINPQDGMVMLDLYGPRVAIERVQRELRAPGAAKSPLYIQVQPTSQSGHTMTLSILNDVANNSLFQDAGVTVNAVSPPQIWVEVDEWDERDLEVKAPDSVMATLSHEPVFSPPTVRMRTPKMVFEQAAKDKQLFVTADLARRPELTDPGHHELTNLSVSWAYHDPDITIPLPLVSASIDVKQRDRTIILPSVPIWVSAPPGFLDKYRVDLSPLAISNVSVSGPPEKISQLERGGDTDIKARVEISTADLQHPDGQKPVKFELPYPGVTVTGESLSVMVTYKILPRNAGE